jgi:hypothetical protein
MEHGSGWGHNPVPVVSDDVYEYFNVVFVDGGSVHDVRLQVGGTVRTAKEHLGITKVSQLWGVRDGRMYLLA